MAQGKTKVSGTKGIVPSEASDLTSNPFVRREVPHCAQNDDLIYEAPGS
jgi:hypothetical protein